MSFNSFKEDSYSFLFDELFPICRSISGPGLERSLDIFGQFMPLEITRTPSGTKVFDWTTPPEWAINDAILTGPDGKIICDFRNNNLHVVNYSIPVDRTLSLEELRPHLFSIAEQPDIIPYVTSYYKDNWGFCLPKSTIDALKPGMYHAKIDSLKYPGSIPFGMTTLPGKTDKEIFLSSYLCHPSLANNELSGPLVLLGLYHRLARWENRHFTYRFVLAPETIGSLCVLNAIGEHLLNNVEAGLVLTCLGGPNTSLTYKTTRRENTLLDQLMRDLNARDSEHLKIRTFTPISGSDERQYCSPGFNLPIGQIARTAYGDYIQYHNSGDTKEFMGIKPILDSVNRIENILKLYEYSGIYHNTAPFGEPQLGKRNLYPSVNAPSTWKLSTDEKYDGRKVLERILYVLNYTDGKHTMLDIARKAGCSLSELTPIIDQLQSAGLLRN